MSTATALRGFILAGAAAGMFAGAGFVAAGEGHGAVAKIHCEGVNACGGKSDCKGKNECKGKNSCKGQGFLEMSKEECDAAKAKMEKGS